MGATSSYPDAERLYKQHRMLFHDDAGSRLSFHPSSLSSESDIRHLVDRMGESIGSREKRVAGSIFIKRYSSFITGALDLWIHSRFTVDLESVTASIEGGGLCFSISTQPANGGEDFLRDLFAGNATRVIDAVAAYTKVSEATLWANLSYLVVYRFEEWIRNTGSEELKERLRATYRRILHEPSPDWFPGKARSPLTTRFRPVEDPLETGNRILVRAKCCLSYRLPGEDRYCYTCPMISDECRIEKYKKSHGK